MSNINAKDFRTFRLNWNLTVLQIANMLGCVSSTIVRYENGRYPIPPSVSQLMIIWRDTPAILESRKAEVIGPKILKNPSPEITPKKRGRPKKSAES